MTGKAIAARLALALFVAGAAIGASAIAAEPGPVYQAMIEKYPAPKLADVEGREYKFLIDPAKTSPDMAAAFKDLWGRIKRSRPSGTDSRSNEKEKNPLAIELSTKEYFDTTDQALWNKGYLIRITTRYKDGKPERHVDVTVKSVLRRCREGARAPLTVAGVDKSKTEAEETPSASAGRKLAGTSRRAPASACRSRPRASARSATSASTCPSC